MTQGKVARLNRLDRRLFDRVSRTTPQRSENVTDTPPRPRKQNDDWAKAVRAARHTFRKA